MEITFDTHERTDYVQGQYVLMRVNIKTHEEGKRRSLSYESVQLKSKLSEEEGLIDYLNQVIGEIHGEYNYQKALLCRGNITHAYLDYLNELLA